MRRIPLKFIVLLGIGIFLFTGTASAQQQDAGCQLGLFGKGDFSTGFQCVLDIASNSNIQADQDIRVFILSIIRFVMGLVALVALAFVIYAGVRYIMSRGEESETEKAKKTLLYAIIGLLLIGISIILVNTVIGFLQAGGDGGGNQGQGGNAGGGGNRQQQSQQGGAGFGGFSGSSGGGPFLPSSQ